MVVYIQYKRKDDTGKGKFLQRLMPALGRLGVRCQNHPKHADLALGIWRWRDKVPKGMPKMLRVDGCYLWANKRTLWRNRLQRNSIKASDGIIWQSHFSKRMVSAVLNVKPKREWVIYNGADPKEYAPLSTINEDSTWTVVCSARWKGRPHKRLRECIDIAETFEEKYGCQWFFCGYGTEGLASSRRITFTGLLNEQKLAHTLANAHVMLNLSWADWCPNAVVEALAAGCRVVCNNESGAAELVRASGWGTVVEVDRPVIPKLKKGTTREPPPMLLNPTEIAGVVFYEMRKWAPQPHKPWAIHIDTIAAQYKSAFEELLNGQSR